LYDITKAVTPNMFVQRQLDVSSCQSELTWRSHVERRMHVLTGKSYWLMHRAAQKGCPILLFIIKFSKEECRIGGTGQRILPSGQEVDISVKVATGGKRQAILSNITATLRATYILIHTGDDLKIICRFLQNKTG
jgi:hypothetical protein